MNYHSFIGGPQLTEIPDPPQYMINARDHWNKNPNEMVRIAKEQQNNSGYPFPCAPNDPDCPSFYKRSVDKRLLEDRQFKWTLMFTGPSIDGPLGAYVFFITDFEYDRSGRITFVYGHLAPDKVTDVYTQGYYIWAVF
ncbi:hypothetical protein [Bacillus altitudinis]|uniref:hypothetical protein n=1 Tax=Bacillus altitudinis TaxID=293387 RepID=UPI0011A00050|nr:hypothetical protein [Bacillus altitudinis]